MGNTVKMIEVRTTSHRQMVDITRQVENELSNIGEGLCHVHIPHTTAAVVINENADPDVQRDLLAAYETLIPNIRFKHMEGNSDAHLKSSLFGCSETILIDQGQLVLGQWQSLFFCEFDGPRNRRLIVKVI